MLIRGDDPEDSDSDDELFEDAAALSGKMVDKAITMAALYSNKVGYFPNLKIVKSQKNEHKN